MNQAPRPSARHCPHHLEPAEAALNGHPLATVQPWLIGAQQYSSTVIGLRGQEKYMKMADRRSWATIQHNHRPLLPPAPLTYAMSRTTAPLTDSAAASRKPITVYSVGVFDLLHVAHVRFLEDAKRLGDRLIVGVHSDEVVAGYKRKPVIPYEQRVEMVASLKCVDKVIEVRRFFAVHVLSPWRLSDSATAHHSGASLTHAEGGMVRLPRD